MGSSKADIKIRVADEELASEIEGWLENVREFWNGRLDELERVLREDQ